MRSEGGRAAHARTRPRQRLYLSARLAYARPSLLHETEPVVACACGSRTRSPSSQPMPSAALWSRAPRSSNASRAADRRPPLSDATFNASRHVVLPGLVNAHHHFYQTLTRAHPAGFGKELIPWLVTMERVWDRMTPEALRIAIRMALVELLLSGCTTAADHHNLFPPGLENAIDIEVEEATKLGLRMTVTRGSMGISEKDGGLQPDSIVQDSETILEDSERVLRPLSRSEPRRDDPRRARALLAARRAEAGDGGIGRTRRALRLPAAHPSLPVARRGRLRRRDVRHALGRSPGGGRLARAPAPGSRMAFISTRARSSAWARRASASAIAPPPTWRSAWASARRRSSRRRASPIGLGVDGSASNDSSNMMEAVRHSLMLQRLSYGPSAVTPYDALRWATEGSARCLGRDDIGAIAPGHAGRPRALHARRAALLSGAQDPDRRARALRRPPRRPGDGRGRHGGSSTASPRASTSPP